MYPLSIGLPLIISVVIHTLLWAGTFLHIEWMNRLSMMGMAGGAAATASIALVFYRILALEKPWDLTIVVASFIQFLAWANSLLFLYAAYMGRLPQWLDAA